MASNTDIESLLKEAEKSLKCFVGVGSAPSAKLRKISTGIPILDHISGGGLVRGRIHLFTGGFTSGKTFVAQQAMATVQKGGGIAAYIDAERRFDPEWFALTGVNIDELILTRPLYGEQALDAVIFYCNKVDVIVIDSLAALVPLAEDQESMEKQSIGLQARMFNKWCRKVVPVNDSSVIIAINQQRQEIGNVYSRGIHRKMPGGEGQYYFASMIVDFRRGEYIAPEGRRVGHEINILVSKCNFHPPFGTCKVPLIYKTGTVENESSIVTLAIDLGIIDKKGAWYVYKGQKIQGMESVVTFFKENAEEFEVLKKACFDVEEEVDSDLSVHGQAAGDQQAAEQDGTED